jgi:hypothetical protein
MLETASNQAYIFATNRQREQVGGSELVAQSTTAWIVEALPAGTHPWAGTPIGRSAIAKGLSDSAVNPPLGSANAGAVELCPGTVNIHLGSVGLWPVM